MVRHPCMALVLEPDDSVRSELHATLASLSIQASGASTAKQAIKSLSIGFELVLVNADLPDPALELVQAAFALRKPPTVFVTGTAPEPHCLFELAKIGAHAYLAPPVSAAAVQACLHAFSLPEHLLQLVRPLVGHLGMKEIQAHVRRALLSEALARSGGSRRSAAQLLGVSRPAIQKWLRSLAPEELSPSESW